MTEVAPERRDTVGGFLKGLAVIEAFDVQTPRQSISDISKATGLDRATCRRLLHTLVHAGFAEHEGKQFWLSPKIIRLGASYLHSATLPNVLQPFIERLATKVSESCSASIQDDLEVIYIARASAKRVMSINLTVGSRLPMYCSSMGRVILATLSEDEARKLLERSELQARTQFTITSIDKLMEEIRRVRENGFAIVDQELELGLRSIAVPIMDTNGDALAALNIGTHASAVSQSCLETTYLAELQATKAEVEKTLVGAVMKK